MATKVLFIGGTGVISSACSPRAVEMGLELTLLLRGETPRDIPEGAEVIHADIRDRASVETALGGRTFDVVVDWIAYTPEQIEMDLALFHGRTAQFIFISSASAYQTPAADLPITESTVLANPFWGYSRDKIACEERLLKAYREEGFPITIVRPSHTYDQTGIPMHGGYTVIDRMRRGKKVIVQGDGSSLWTLTHHKDFARGFVGLLGNAQAIGQAVHITSDEWVTWDAIFNIYAQAAGTQAQIVHVPSDMIAAYLPDWRGGLIGDNTHSLIFDNSKIKRLVPSFRAEIPLAWGAREALAWYDADPARRRVNAELDTLMDTIIAAQEQAYPK